MNINNDNLFHLSRFYHEPPHPSYIGGFIDGDGCIFIHKIKDGYQSGISINQSRTNILQVIRNHFGGSISSSQNRNNKNDDKILNNGSEIYHKHNKRNQYNLIIRSNEYEVLLNYLKDYIIIKQPQLECLYEINKLVNLPNKHEEKEKLYESCLNLKKDKILYNIHFEKINIEYIQGFFDAEGCIYIDGKNINKYKITITQKNYPAILYEIQKFFGYGSVSDEYKYVIYNKNDCLNFIQSIKKGVIVKYRQVCAFETFLTTIDKERKEEMYKICNKEKHEIEHFTDLNQNDKGKERFLECLKFRNIKQEICKEIHLKQVYKEKSEKMKGNGNYNFGKKFSEETRIKISNSIRQVKGSISDEIIIQIKKMIQEGKRNCDIQKLLCVPLHSITRIKNGTICCRNETKEEKKQLMTQTEINISKRKIAVDEILIAIEKIINGIKPILILNFLVKRRNDYKMENTLTIDIIKNIKRNIQQNKLPFYSQEICDYKYNYYKTMVETYAIKHISI